VKVFNAILASRVSGRQPRHSGLPKRPVILLVGRCVEGGKGPSWNDLLGEVRIAEKTSRLNFGGTIEKKNVKSVVGGSKAVLLEGRRGGVKNCNGVARAGPRENVLAAAIRKTKRKIEVKGEKSGGKKAKEGAQWGEGVQGCRVGRGKSLGA